MLEPKIENSQYSCLVTLSTSLLVWQVDEVKATCWNLRQKCSSLVTLRKSWPPFHSLLGCVSVSFRNCARLKEWELRSLQAQSWEIVKSWAGVVIVLLLYWVLTYWRVKSREKTVKFSRFWAFPNFLAFKLQFENVILTWNNFMLRIRDHIVPTNQCEAKLNTKKKSMSW